MSSEKPRRRSEDPRTEEEWDELADEMRAAVSGPELGGELPAELDDLHARNVRIHGRTRADWARWKALTKLAMFLYECEKRRKERAMLDALEALERAKEAERGEARWLRVGCYLARRVDAVAARMGRRAKLVTRIDFSPAPAEAELGEAIDWSDIDTEEIEW